MSGVPTLGSADRKPISVRAMGTNLSTTTRTSGEVVVLTVGLLLFATTEIRGTRLSSSLAVSKPYLTKRKRRGGALKPKHATKPCSTVLATSHVIERTVKQTTGTFGVYGEGTVLFAQISIRRGGVARVTCAETHRRQATRISLTTDGRAKRHI